MSAHDNHPAHDSHGHGHGHDDNAPHSTFKGYMTGFILSAQASGRRLVLVITGKGRGDIGPLPTRSGALRHEVPHWLHMAPMAGFVMQVVPAHLRHGGGGAYYVYLRRSGRG